MRFDDGHVCTFRPSALLHAEEGADGSYIIAPPPQPKSRPKEPAVSSAHSLSNKHNTTPSSEGVLIPGNGMILCDLQTDLWIGAKVRILSGELFLQRISHLRLYFVVHLPVTWVNLI